MISEWLRRQLMTTNVKTLYNTSVRSITRFLFQFQSLSLTQCTIITQFQYTTIHQLGYSEELFVACLGYPDKAVTEQNVNPK